MAVGVCGGDGDKRVLLVGGGYVCDGLCVGCQCISGCLFNFPLSVVLCMPRFEEEGEEEENKRTSLRTFLKPLGCSRSRPVPSLPSYSAFISLRRARTSWLLRRSTWGLMICEWSKESVTVLYVLVCSLIALKCICWIHCHRTLEDMGYFFRPKVCGATLIAIPSYSKRPVRTVANRVRVKY